ncbi:MAG: hypothetical protein HOP36_05510 [Methyloglobulus sp.]|nr:hypothetical protein [Methyloglobulus sp.]
MSKFILSLIISTAVVGCDQLANNQKNQMKWAVVDKNKIDNALNEYIKKKNPVPAELGNEEESYRERSKIQSHISELESNATQKCVSVNTTSDKKVQGETDTIHTAPSMKGSGGFNINGHYLPLSAISNFPKVTNQENYHNCLSEISKDPLISDLQLQLNKLQKSTTERHRYDTEIRKKAAEYTHTILAKYAEANHFELMVSNNYGGENILYNADKVSLNVTDDVLAFISKNHESATNETSNNKPIQK